MSVISDCNEPETHNEEEEEAQLRLVFSTDYFVAPIFSFQS